MALVPQSSFLSSLKPITTKTSICTFKNLKLSCSLGPSDAQELPQEPVNDAIKLAFAKARVYKKAVKSNPTPNVDVESLVQESDKVDENNDGLVSEDGNEEVPLPVKLVQESDKVDENNDGLVSEDGGEEVPLPVKLAFLQAKEHKKNSGVAGGSEKTSGVERGDSLSTLLKNSADAKEESRSNGLTPEDKENKDQEIPLALRLALEKAKKYKENKGVLDSNKSAEGSEETSGLNIRDGVDPASTFPKNKANKKEELKVSSIDFVGLNFSDKKKSRGLPAGLVPVADPFPEGDLPEVEIVIGDDSKFGDGAATKVPQSQEDNSNIYKPKVSTWGVFPRPSNISRTYGGGRNIRPGEVLETPEDKAAKQALTRQLIAAYNSKIGLKIDPKLKSECEKALKDGDALMDIGNLKEALPVYEKVMDKLAFQTELHGLAALQWSICQDSLSRPNKARAMYEKLQSHPNPQVNKKARQFMFGFQAMEMMKVTNSRPSLTSIDYQSYFEAFVRDKENYSPKESEDDEGALTQAFPYILFLVSPILIVFFIAVQKAGIY